MELTADNVEKIIIDCLFKDGEVEDDGKGGLKYSVQPTVVSGIVNNYGLHPKRLQLHKREVKTMLLQLPENFFVDSGGGWSFLNLCMRADGVQWTGLHQTQEHLCVLAIGLGFASWLPDDRNLWAMFPGGLPYFQIDVRKEELRDDRAATQ